MATVDKNPLFHFPETLGAYRSRVLGSVDAVTFDSVNDGGHPCHECTICLASIPEGTRYVNWELRMYSDGQGLEHICMECDWVLRNHISNGTVKYLVQR
jgi:hypothetical protein